MTTASLVHLVDEKPLSSPQVGMKRPLVVSFREGSDTKRRCVRHSHPLSAACLGYSSTLCHDYSPLHVDSDSVPSPLLRFRDEIIHWPPARICLLAEIMNGQLLDQFTVQYTTIRIMRETGPDILGPRLFVEKLLTAIKVQMHRPLVHFEACRGLLQWMKLDKEVLHEIAHRDHLATLIGSLNFHSKSLHLRYTILEILRSLITFSKEELQRLVSEANVISSIFRLLKDNISDLFTQQIGLSILSWAIEEKLCRDVLIQEGGVDFLLQRMKLHPLNEAVQCNAAATLSWLIHSSEISRSSLLGTKGLVVTLETMNRFISNAMIFGNTACLLSGALVHRSLPVGSDDNIPCLDVVRLVLRGMNIHKHSPKVHRNGLNLLRVFLLLGGNENIDGIVLSLLENLDVIENSTRLHSEETNIQMDACGILALLALHSERARTFIQQSGCIETVFQLCQLKHCKNLRVQQKALCFYCCLLRGHPSEAEIAFGGGNNHHVLESMTAGMVPLHAHLED